MKTVKKPDTVETSLKIIGQYKKQPVDHNYLVPSVVVKDRF